jgi:hypothetical protein
MGRKVMHTGLLLGKSNGKIPIGRPRHTWMDNIKMNLGKIG